MKNRLVLVTVVALSTGCGGDAPSSVEIDQPGVVARWDGGELTLIELEERLPSSRTPNCQAAMRGGGTVELLLPCYREIAEQLFVEQQIIEAEGTPDELAAQLEMDFGEEIRELEFQLTIRAFFETVGSEIEVPDAEIEARFDRDRDRFRQPSSLTLWNLFRRHEDPARPEETLAFLREIKLRVEEGELFPALAREHSHSETRLRDGLVGQVVEGRLPERLNEVAFALEDGEVSEPIEVRGGAVLLTARNLVEGVEGQIETARGVLERELRAERLKEVVIERTDGLSAEAEDVRFDREDLIAELHQASEESEILSIDDRSMTVQQLLESSGVSVEVDRGELDEAQRDRILDVYEQQLRNALLVRQLRQADDEVSAEVSARVAERVQREASQLLVESRLRDQMTDVVKADQDALTEYFESNEHHYQSPLQFHIRAVRVPFGDDPPEQLRELESAREQLQAGSSTLEQLSERMGGEIEDLGWRTLAELREVPGKGQTYLLQVESGGFSVPFQHEEAIHLLHLVERREPSQMTYDEASEQVLEDYVSRFQQRLGRQIIDARIEESGFRVSEDEIRAALVGEG